jgi:pyruvate carboxylase
MNLHGILPPAAVALLWMTALGFSPKHSHGQSNTNPILIESAILKTVEVTSVAAQVQGILKEVSVREGDRVKYQSPMATIQSTASELQLQRAKVALDAAETRLVFLVDVDFVPSPQLAMLCSASGKARQR